MGVEGTPVVGERAHRWPRKEHSDCRGEGAPIGRRNGRGEGTPKDSFIVATGYGSVYLFSNLARQTKGVKLLYESCILRHMSLLIA